MFSEISHSINCGAVYEALLTDKTGSHRFVESASVTRDLIFFHRFFIPPSIEKKYEWRDIEKYLNKRAGPRKR